MLFVMSALAIPVVVEHTFASRASHWQLINADYAVFNGLVTPIARDHEQSSHNEHSFYALVYRYSLPGSGLESRLRLFAS
jgi:hypothetical protein